MGLEGKTSVVHRKARATREGGDSRHMSLARAIRLSLAREADQLFDLALTVATVEQRRVELGDVASALQEDGLLAVLEGEGGRLGAVSLDPQFLAALIEVQTTGKVGAGPLRSRVATPTDAAMALPLIDGLFKESDAMLAEALGDHEPSRFRYVEQIADLRSLGLILTAPGFDFFRLTLDLGPGARMGRMDLLLPHVERVHGGVSSREVMQGGDGNLREAAINAPVVLDTVLARISQPLKEIWALRPGSLIELPGDSLHAVQLLGTNGHLVAEARLGQLNGWRAICLQSSSGAPLPVRLQTRERETSEYLLAAPVEQREVPHDDGALSSGTDAFEGPEQGMAGAADLVAYPHQASEPV